MNRRLLLLNGVATAMALFSAAAPLRGATTPERVDFNYHIKPLLSDRCYVCHGPDEKARKAKLRLDRRRVFKAAQGGNL